MKPSTKRALAPLAVAGALVLTGVPPASANHLPFPGPPLHFDAGFVCDFELLLDSKGGKLRTIQFPDDHPGPVTLIQAGKGVVLTYTNLETGESVSINTAGSVLRVMENDDGTSTGYITGHYGLITFDGDADGPGVRQFTGRAKFTIGEGNVFGKVTNSGQVRDICAELDS